jgi:hypothetical protein
MFLAQVFGSHTWPLGLIQSPQSLITPLQDMTATQKLNYLQSKMSESLQVAEEVTS